MRRPAAWREQLLHGARDPAAAGLGVRPVLVQAHQQGLQLQVQSGRSVEKLLCISSSNILMVQVHQVRRRQGRGAGGGAGGGAVRRLPEGAVSQTRLQVRRGQEILCQTTRSRPRYVYTEV